MTAATCKVVGMVAGGRQHVVAYVAVNDPVLLLPEPDNPHDGNAVAVYTAPRTVLLHPEVLVSSLRDPAGGGTIHPLDRSLLIDRQAGYLPRDLAARLTLPAEGIVGYVAEVRWAPTEYDREGRPTEPRPAGFDVVADLTFKDHP